MTEQTAPSWLAVAAAVTPLAVSLAANITWGVSTGSAILVVAGIVTPLLLVLAIERWRVMPPADGTQWWVRTLAMSGVVVVVAGWSWLHATALLLAEVEKLHPGVPAPGMDTVLRNVELTLCVLAPLAVDGLAVLSVLALDVQGRTGSAGQPEQVDEHPAEPVRVPAEHPERPAPNRSVDPGPAPAEPVRSRPARALSVAPAPVDDDRFADFPDWAASLSERPTKYAIRQRYGCGNPKAGELLASLDDDPEDDRADRAV